MYAGTGVGGIAYPYIMSGLLNSVGYKAALVSMGIGYAIIGSIALIPVNRRVPISRYHFEEPGRRKQISFSFLKRSVAFTGSLIILFVSMGNFIPTVWLPCTSGSYYFVAAMIDANSYVAYADDLKLRHINGTALIAILNAATIPGNILLGYFSDYSIRAVIIVSCVGSALGCAFLWGFGTNAGMLVAFAIVYGLLGSSFQCLWSNMIGVISSELLYGPMPIAFPNAGLQRMIPLLHL